MRKESKRHVGIQQRVGLDDVVWPVASDFAQELEAMATPLPSTLFLPCSRSFPQQPSPQHSLLLAALPQHTGTVSCHVRGRRSLVRVDATAGSSSQSGSVAEEEKLSTSSGFESGSGTDSNDISPSNISISQRGSSISPTACQACGKEEKVGGCNGEGRILGGLGAVPGFGWFPIKAYRPCPAFVEAGGRYKRQGQSLEEVAFGRPGRKDNLDISERLQDGRPD